MAGERTIKIKFVGDTTGLDQAAQRGQTSMGKWQAATTAFGTAAGIALERAGRALFDFAKQSVAAFAESEESQARLGDAFARFPSLADTNIAKIQALNTELARKTKFDDDAYASGQAVLAQFGLTGRELETLTPLLADFAAKTGQDLPGAAEQLGKAFLGNTRALKAIGIEYESTGNQAQDVANITALLRQQVGGFAEQQGQTAAGQAAILNNQFGELKETLGSKLLPVMMKAADVGLRVVDWIDKNRQIAIPLIAVIGTLVAVQWAWNIAMMANPIGLIIGLVIALIGAIVWIATKTTWFQDIWNAAWGWIKRTAVDVWEWLSALPGRIGSVFAGIADAIGRPFKAAFNFISDAWNNTVGRLSWTVPSWVPIFGGNTISAPKLPKFHMGGVVPGPFGKEVPILARAGEEIVTAEDRGRNIEVRVFIGDQELRGIVRYEVGEINRGVRRRVLAGAGAR